MQRRTWTAFTVLLLLVVSVSMQTQAMALDTSPDAAAQAAADNGLKIFTKLVTEKNADLMGFKSSNEISKKLELGIPLKVFLVGFKGLDNYKPGGNPESVLIDMHRFIYPVKVDGEVRSSLTVAKIKDGKGWKAIQFGSPKLITLLCKYRKPGSNPGCDPGSDFVVWVPRRYLHFIGVGRGFDMKLISIATVSENDLIAGKNLDPKEVFPKLKSQQAASPSRTSDSSQQLTH